MANIEGMRLRPRDWRRAAVWTAAMGVYAAQAWPFRGWVVDDAGISFAFARNLAAGHGLVSQPGLAPVEGFSNPLWTLLLAPWFAAGAFHPLWTPKLMAAGLVGATFALILRATGSTPVGRATGLLTLLLLGIGTPFVVWTTSGLENALLAFLVTLLSSLGAYAATPAAAGTPDVAQGGRPWVDAASGLVAALAALTRPDAVLHAVVFPAVVTIADARSGSLRRCPGRLGRYLLGLAPPLLAWQVVRLGWFGDPMPNTYHAKGGPYWPALADAGKAWDLVIATSGALAPLALAVLAIGLTAHARAGTLWPGPAVRLLHLAVATAAYLVLPEDWMGEYRFATPFFVLFAWCVCDALGAAWRAVPRLTVARAALGLAAAALAVHTGLVHVPRSAAFARDPTVPFTWVAELGGRGFNRLADVLDREDASVMLPDVGGALFESRLRVYDLAGLCDRVTARTLGSDRAAFHEYVFETTRPTFIHVHGAWADRAALGEDPRFARDYVALREAWSTPRAEPGKGGRAPWAADYVRRDALAGMATLDRLRAEFHTAGMDGITPWPRRQVPPGTVEVASGGR